jgi:hypothetical protein
MTIVPLNCNHCGAPLKVPDTARFATCQFCHAQLAVKHEGSAWFTEVLEKLTEQTSSIADELREMRLKQELKELDQDWDAARSKIIGNASENFHPKDLLWISWILMAFGVFMFFAFPEQRSLIGRRNQTAGGWIPLICLGLAVVIWLFAVGQSKLLEETTERFRLRRQRLIDRFHSARDNDAMLE